MFSVSTFFKEELNLMLKVLRLLVKVRLVEALIHFPKYMVMLNERGQMLPRQGKWVKMTTDRHTNSLLHLRRYADFFFQLNFLPPYSLRSEGVLCKGCNPKNPRIGGYRRRLFLHVHKQGVPSFPNS